MQFGNNGKMVFSTIEELFSDLFMEIGLAVKNNYVSFAGFTWRIVRINEDGTIRISRNLSFVPFRFKSFVGFRHFKFSFLLHRCRGDNIHVGVQYILDDYGIHT